MSRNGYLGWTRPLFNHLGVWLDGRYYRWFEAGASGWSWSEGQQFTLLELADGSTQAIGYFRGLAAPINGGRVREDVTLRVAPENEYRFLQLSAAKGAPVDFSDGAAVWESFEATAGEDYTLKRRDAAQELGLDPGLYGARIYLDGDEAAAGTLAGSTLSATETGLITVEYRPLYYVAIQQEHAVQAAADYVVTLSLEEHRP